MLIYFNIVTASDTLIFDGSVSVIPRFGTSVQFVRCFYLSWFIFHSNAWSTFVSRFS